MAIKPKSQASKSRETGFITKTYLLAYNFGQFLGWSYLLFISGMHFLNGGTLETLWSSVRLVLVIFQNAALLEILNVAIGIVKSNLVITTFQVFSRVMVVCGILLATPTAPQSYGLPLLLLAWSVTEIVRYLFYALNILNMVPYFLIWCRYTFFYVLYPIGVTGELLCFYAAQSFVKETKMWSMELPNIANFTFSYHYILLLIMFLYIPLFPKMYLHMFSQRRKVIGGGSEKKSS